MRRHHLPAAATVVALIFASLALAPRAAAEVFLLRSGGRIEGELLNPGREPGTPYQVRTGDGLRMALGEGQVSRVVVKSDVQKQYDELRPKVVNTAIGHWEMAEWCKEAGLLDERKRHLATVITIEPDHKAARTALGYSEIGGRWMTQEEFMHSQGYVRSKGAWRSQQEVELEARARETERLVKQWRRDIRNWLDQLGDSDRQSDIARAELAAIRDPLAGPALADILADAKQPKATRIACLDMLAKLPPGLASATLVKLAMDDRNEDIRDRCLDELVRQGAHTVLPAFLAELNHKDNTRVNRAAHCLQRLGDPSATLPLINALVTEHKFIINPDGASGGGTPINFNAGGGPGQGGMGGLSMGSKAKLIKTDLKNDQVRMALSNLHPGVNFHFDEEEWRAWYIENFTSTRPNLRRSE